MKVTILNVFGQSYEIYFNHQMYETGCFNNVFRWSEPPIQGGSLCF